LGQADPHYHPFSDTTDGHARTTRHATVGVFGTPLRVLLLADWRRETFCLLREAIWHQAPVAQKLDSPVHRINHYPVDNVIGFPNTYPPNSDLSGG